MEENPSGIHVLEFECEVPLRFYEHCRSCPKFYEDCPDLALGKEILRGKKLLYTDEGTKEGVYAGAFQCLAPLSYFNRTRSNCAHKGRCREEGLLLALLTGKKALVSKQREAIVSPRMERRIQRVAAREAELERESSLR